VDCSAATLCTATIEAAIGSSPTAETIAVPDPNLGALTALGRLRHVETDTARRELGTAVTQETALAAQDAALGRELDAARRLSGDFDRDTFVAWFGRMRAERARLGDAMRDAEARTATARTTLAHRRVAETAAEEALAGALAVKEAALARREQIVLEDVARALKRLTGRGE
jgi:hypothetical protein